MEAVKRWFVHDWQTLDNKIRSSIVEGVSVFLAMFDMPDVAKVFCPVAPLISDDPQAIILQAAIKRARADKDAKEAKQPEAAKPELEPEPELEASKPKAAAGIVYTWGGQPKEANQPEPEPVKTPEAPWVVVEPDDKTPDPSTESNQAATPTHPGYQTDRADHAAPTAAL